MCILAAQQATIHAGLIFGSGTDQQPPAPCWLAALAPCSTSLVPLVWVTCGHLWSPVGRSGSAGPAEFGACVGVGAVPVLRAEVGALGCPWALCSPTAEQASSRF